MINLDPAVKAMQVKSISAKLCSSVSGQVRRKIKVDKIILNTIGSFEVAFLHTDFHILWNVYLRSMNSV